MSLRHPQHHQDSVWCWVCHSRATCTSRFATAGSLHLVVNQIYWCIIRHGIYYHAPSCQSWSLRSTSTMISIPEMESANGTPLPGRDNASTGPLNIVTVTIRISKYWNNGSELWLFHIEVSFCKARITIQSILCSIMLSWHCLKQLQHRLGKFFKHLTSTSHMTGLSLNRVGGHACRNNVLGCRRCLPQESLEKGSPLSCFIGRQGRHP